MFTVMIALGTFAHAEMRGRDPNDGWVARSEFADEITCSLSNDARGADTSAVQLFFVWTRATGPVLNLWGKPLGRPRIRIESPGAEHVWNVAFDERRVLLAGDEATALVRDISRGQTVALTLTYPDRPPERYETNRGFARISVAMYDACVKSLTTDPPDYRGFPGYYLFQISSFDHCGYRQTFEAGKFPVYVTLWAAADRGEVTITRDTVLITPHRRLKARRTQPDQVDARTLYGQPLDLMAEANYGITLEQTNLLAADLLHGRARSLIVETPGSGTFVLQFGGALSRASAAMFAACRAATFAAASAH
jgi:hypothetical protein